MSSYNKYYQKEDFFGSPYPELLEYFRLINKKKRILDMGCGQGRDSIALGRLGFHVVGIDLSSVGIKQMNTIAKKENLNVEGFVRDLYNYDEVSKFDIVLLDSMLHFYKNDIEKESNLVVNLLDQLKHGGELIMFIQKSEFRVQHMKELLENNKNSISIKHESSFLYKEYKTTYYMMVLKKK